MKVSDFVEDTLQKLSILDAISNDFIITSREIGYSAMLERRLADRGINLDPGIDMNSYFLCSSERWINPVMKEFIRIVNMVESYHE